MYAHVFIVFELPLQIIFPLVLIVILPTAVDTASEIMVEMVKLYSLRGDSGSSMTKELLLPEYTELFSCRIF